MCGIVGISLRKEVYNRGHQMHRVKDLFTNMLVEAQLRGSAATGICITTWGSETEKPKVWILRSPLPASEFVKTDDYKNIMEKVDNKCLSLIGHTRAVSSTKAAAEDNRNNHPFAQGTVIGVHNGRVLNDTELWKKYKNDITRKGNCDSEIIIALVNHFTNTMPNISTEEAIDLALQEVDAWYALALINARDPHKVYLVKDDHNPLSLGWWSAPETVVFASEWSYIEKGFGKIAPHSTMSCPIVECEFPTKQIITLDSISRGKAWQDYYIGTHTLKNAKNNQQELIDSHGDEFKTTQGMG